MFCCSSCGLRDAAPRGIFVYLFGLIYELLFGRTILFVDEGPRTASCLLLPAMRSSGPVPVSILRDLFFVSFPFLSNL